MNASNASTAIAGKKSLWPYAIAGYFAIVICAIVVFVSWAVRQRMDLVRADYYDHEIRFQRHIDAANRARAYGQEVNAAYDLSKRTLTVSIPAKQVALGFSGKAHLYRPSDAGLDRQIDLLPEANGKQVINAADLAPGLWKVRLHWTAHGEAFAFEQSIIVGE
jgi:nitrogen fixation protein FixH